MAESQVVTPSVDDNLRLYSTLAIAVPPLVGLMFAGVEAWRVVSIPLVIPSSINQRLTESGCNPNESLRTMKKVSEAISRGARAFLFEEYKWMAVYVAVFSAILYVATDLPTVLAFIIGAVTSVACGFIGMAIACFTNVRTAHQAWHNLNAAFNTALSGGCVMGFCLVSLGIAVFWGLIELFYSDYFGFTSELHRMEALAGYGLGGSSIALFARVGGGIYTKAADVGADLSGKNEFGIDEDDPRNPACIADNVGDNVGDIAGMGADLFGSLAESTCAALVIAAASPQLASHYAYMVFPLTLTSVGIFVGMLTIFAIRLVFPVREIEQIEGALKAILVISTALMTPVAVGLCYYFLPASFDLPSHKNVLWWHANIPIQLGLWAGLVIGLVTEYYTSHTYKPVRDLARTQVISAATGIINGLALGYMSTVVPVICLGITICVSHTFCGMYGIALAALGMLGTLTMSLTIDAYGPISDNAGGIAEMSNLGPAVRRLTDALDAAGNTTAAIGKGFAIGSAALVSLALFGAFAVRANIETVNVVEPWTFTGLLFGAMMPYAFSAMTMKSVGDAAEDMVKECMRQLKAIFERNAEPDYERCIKISTESAIREMVLPGALVIGSPLFFGIFFGKNCVAGLLAGALVSGIQLAISASNSGGAWDNAKKYFEAGGMPGHPKGSAAHKNAVIGDTVGDPCKDTSGPSLNILVKLSAIVSLVFGSMIANTFSNATGGPKWLSA